MKLADLIQGEQDGLPRDRILFLRHADEAVDLLERCGASIQEFTAIQPIGGRFDFQPVGQPQVEVVVAIVRDRVYAVYRVTGVLQVGLSTDICSPGYRTFELSRKAADGQPKIIRNCRKYALITVQSGATGAPVQGWKGREIMPVQRSAHSFFEEIVVDARPLPRAVGEANPIDAEWIEGTAGLRVHLARERAAGLATAKKREFLAKHGRLFCESCNIDPVQKYGTEAAVSCIEVHHATTAVSAMQPGHVTKLNDLKCLCANCHRLEHARLRHPSP